MTIDIQNLLDSILDSLSRIKYIRPETIPGIQLYMDQITSFMEDQLGPSKRHKSDKVLTKAMVNNYVKNDLFPPPEKKKYSKDHLLTLIFIYYFKSVLSIQDIRSILNPVTDKYWSDKSPSLEEIYSMVFSLEEPEVERLKESIREEFSISQETVRSMENLNEKDADFLQKFVFICLLNFDVYVKKTSHGKNHRLHADAGPQKQKEKSRQ